MNHDIQPVLSIIIVLIEDRASLMRVLAAIHPQVVNQQVEVIIPVDDNHADVLDLIVEYPYLKFHVIQGSCTYAQLRSVGVARASGVLVAITEDHCIPNPNWCAQIIAAHQRTAAAIGGSVEKKYPDTILNWAVYFADYLRYMNPIKEGETASLTDLNVSYKHSSLEKIALTWQNEFHENVVNNELYNETLWLNPEMVVFEQRDFSLPQALRDRYAFGRLFASTRLGNAPISRKIIYSAFALFVPILQIYRTTRQIIQKKRFIGKYLTTLPLLILLCTFWGVGELLGYLTGKPAATIMPTHVEG